MRTSAIWNHTKVAILVAALTALLGGAGMATGGTTGLLLALVIAVAMNTALYLWSDRVVLRSYGARLVTSDEAPALFAIVNFLRLRAGLPMPRIAIVPNPQPNAFATGRSPRHAVIGVTEGLLRTLEPDELAGVLAHEIAHVKQRDTLLMTVTATLAGAVASLANLVAFSSLFGSSEDEGGSWLSNLAFVLLAPIAATIIQLAISRQREFRADALGAEIAGDAHGLARALAMLERGAIRDPMTVSPTAAPLAQVDPLGRTGSRLLRLFATHPATSERIARLDAVAQARRVRPAPTRGPVVFARRAQLT